MSESTMTTLSEAISAHIADEHEGDIVTAWVIVAETTRIDMLDSGEGVMVIEHRPTQSHYLTQGLLHAALNVNGAEQ